ncbi:retrotransposon protein, putative, ty1-copia subclass [Tanacetum coccineum]
MSSIIELFSFPTKSWVYDTSCGTYICNTKPGFRIEKKLKQGLFTFTSGQWCFRVQVEAIRSFDLVLPNGLVICLDNCHYAPTITRGVVSVSRLVDNGFVQCFTDCGISVSKNGVLYFNVVPRNGIYEIDMHDLVPNVNSIYNLKQDGLLKSTDDESFDKCESCLSGKMTKKHFPHSNERAKDLLGIIHTDVCGPLRHVSRQGASYFITFTDDYSRYGYVYLLKHKHELTPPYTPQHNGVSERRNRTLLDMIPGITRISQYVPTKKVERDLKTTTSRNDSDSTIMVKGPPGDDLPPGCIRPEVEAEWV